MAVDDEHTVCANRTRLCMRLKVLRLVQAKLYGRLAVLRDSHNPIPGDVFLVLFKEVMVGLADDKRRNDPCCRVNALDNCCLLPVTWLTYLWPSSCL